MKFRKWPLSKFFLAEGNSARAREGEPGGRRGGDGVVGSKSLCKDCNLVQAASSPLGSRTLPQSGPGQAAGAALVRLLYRGPQVPGEALGSPGGGGSGSAPRGGTGCRSRPVPQGGRMALLSSLARGRAPAHSHRWSASSTVKKSRDARDSRHRCARSESAQGLSLGLGAQQQQQQQIVSAAASFPGHIQAPLNIFQGGPGWKEQAGARPDGRLGRASGLSAAVRSSAPSRLYLGGCMVRQAGRPGAPLRPESRGALVLSPRPSRAPSLTARARPPGRLGAARRPGGGRCGALGRWRLRLRRRAPHTVGPLSCPRLRNTPLGTGGRPPRTLSRPSRLGAALRPSAPPCGPGHRAPLARLAPLRSRPLPAPRRSLPCSRSPRPADRPAHCLALRALLVLWPLAGAGPGPAALQLLACCSLSSGSGGPPGSRRRHRRRTRTPGFT